MSDSSSDEGVKKRKSKKTLQRVLDVNTNPCLKEAEYTRNCLQSHLYRREECKLEYDNYNECKKFWGRIKNERSLAGIQPNLPEKEERDKILKMKAAGINVNSVQ